MDVSLWSLLDWAWRFSRLYRYRLLLYLLMEIVSLSLSLLFIWWSKKAIDYAVLADRDRLEVALISAILSFVIGMIISFYSSRLNERTRVRMLMDLQKQVVHAQMCVKWRVIKEWHTGDVTTRFNMDCQEVVQMIGEIGIKAVITVIKIVASTVFLWWMDPMLAGILMALCSLLIFSKLYFRRLRRLHRHLKIGESKLGNILQENLRFRLLIRMLNLEEIRWQKVTDSQQELYGIKMDILNFSSISRGVLNMASGVGFMTTFVWGVSQLYTGAVTFGTMSAFLQLVSRIQVPILTLMGFIPSFVRFRVALERLQELLNVEKETPTDAIRFDHISRLEINGLSFRYDDQQIFNGFKAIFRKGMPTAVIGASGKGKTTLIRLILSLLTPDTGRIILDTEMGEVNLSSSHLVNFVHVPQGDKLFTGTIRENLQVRKTEVPETDMEAALRAACACFVYDLPDGLDTVIGESGYGLSEGQAQRIAVARGMLLSGGIWLFDEVTSSLDPDTSARMTKRLIKAGRDRILIFVTHDLSLAASCSQIINIT